MAFRRLLSAAVLVLALSAFASTSAQSHPADPSGDIRVITQEIQSFAELSGVTISDVKFALAPHAGDASITSTPCTVSATVSIPDATGVSVSATAPACLEAWRMVRAMIADMA